MIKLIILGIVQGFTEFLPVSSSGHLAILEKLFGLTEHAVALAIVLHLGTLVSVCVFFYRDIISALRSKRIVLFILVVTLITGVIGILGKDFFETLFSSVKAIAIGWIATGFLLLLAQRSMRGVRSTVSVKDAMILGVTQGVAIIPGVSRSGITISTLLLLKIDKMTAFTFSFLVSVPAIAGAALLESRKINSAVSADPKQLVIGFVCSSAAGLFALWFLKRAVKNAQLHYFAYYCFVLAAIALTWIK
jgi:undecaprenyl-diphosphatase